MAVESEFWTELVDFFSKFWTNWWLLVLTGIVLVTVGLGIIALVYCTKPEFEIVTSNNEREATDFRKLSTVSSCHSQLQDIFDMS